MCNLYAVTKGQQAIRELDIMVLFDNDLDLRGAPSECAE
jgi:hypothetical protein